MFNMVNVRVYGVAMADRVVACRMRSPIFCYTFYSFTLLCNNINVKQVKHKVSSAILLLWILLVSRPKTRYKT